MKKWILVILIFFFTNTAKAIPGVYVEKWTVINTLQVKVIDFDAQDLDIADCTADYIRDNLGDIGKGSNFYVGGMALVDIEVEEHAKLKDINDFQIRCESIDNQ